jgi:orotate phosphoribosyltransferase
MSPMPDDEILSAFVRAGAVQHGHFVLTSGKHSDTYIQCARVLEDPDLTTNLAREAVSRLPADADIDIVAAPAVGGIVIGFAVAQDLGVRFIFTERVEDAMAFRRGFEVPRGARVLVVEDVVTTGGSVAEVVELVTEAGGVPIGIVSLVDRGGPKAFETPFWPLLRLQVEAWEPRECGPCRQRIPVTSPGSRRLNG